MRSASIKTMILMFALTPIGLVSCGGKSKKSAPAPTHEEHDDDDHVDGGLGDSTTAVSIMLSGMASGASIPVNTASSGILSSQGERIGINASGLSSPIFTLSQGAESGLSIDGIYLVVSSQALNTLNGGQTIPVSIQANGTPLVAGQAGSAQASFTLVSSNTNTTNNGLQPIDTSSSFFSQLFSGGITNVLSNASGLMNNSTILSGVKNGASGIWNWIKGILPIS